MRLKGFRDIIILSGVLVVVASLFLIIKLNRTRYLQNRIQNSYPKSDITANWKTYKNVQYKFEFKYPNNIQLNDNSEGSIILTWIDDKDALPQGYLNMQLGQWEKKFFYGGDFQKILPKLKKLNIGDKYIFKVGATNWEQEIVRIPNTYISGIESNVYKSEIAWERPGPWTVIYTPLQNDYFLVEISYNEDVNFDYENTFKQILSTFKFTD